MRAERRALQAAVIAAGLVPVGAGLLGILVGPAAFGLAPPRSPGPVPVDLESHLAYLSGLLLAIGLAFWSFVPRIERAGPGFRLLATLVVVGGLARLLSLGLDGVPSGGHLFGLAMELGVTPALALWQRRVAWLAGTGHVSVEPRRP